MTNLKTRLEGHQEGFTLVELLIVVLIIGILAAIAIPVFNGQRNKAKDSKAKSSVRNALSGAKAFYAENESYTGITNASIVANESSLSVATPPPFAASDFVGGSSDYGPTEIYVQGVGAQTMTACAASENSTSTVFCITDAPTGAGSTRTQGASAAAQGGSW